MNKNHILETHNMHFLGRNNIILYCSVCCSIIGTVNRENLKYAKMSIKCRCGSFGYLKESLRNENEEKFKKSKIPLYRDEFSYICIKDEIKLFSLSKDVLTIFGYKITCNCDTTYEEIIKFYNP
ncbi:MAG: hypothetical protein LBJ09_02510 [Clostridiales bacterium]|jgi:hypothetical protein|nr:hypothetical protein [Clostridiales bacterium]